MRATSPTASPRAAAAEIAAALGDPGAREWRAGGGLPPLGECASAWATSSPRCSACWRDIRGGLRLPAAALGRAALAALAVGLVMLGLCVAGVVLMMELQLLGRSSATLRATWWRRPAGLGVAAPPAGDGVDYVVRLLGRFARLHYGFPAQRSDLEQADPTSNSLVGAPCRWPVSPSCRCPSAGVSRAKTWRVIAESGSTCIRRRRHGDRRRLGAACRGPAAKVRRDAAGACASRGWRGRPRRGARRPGGRHVG